MRPPTSPVVLIGLVLWTWLAVTVGRSAMPTWVKVLAWIGAAVVGLYSFAQAVEYFTDKYRQFGPGIRQALQGWWASSPRLATAIVALCALKDHP